jgi:hypothetical protein
MLSAMQRESVGVLQRFSVRASGVGWAPLN